MPKIPYGFQCRSFSVVLSSNGVIVPGESDQPLRKSLVPTLETGDTAGCYTLRVKSGTTLICDLPVALAWVLHPSQIEPFLGIKADHPSELRESLAMYQGKPVKLEFVPR